MLSARRGLAGAVLLLPAVLSACGGAAPAPPATGAGTPATRPAPLVVAPGGRDDGPCTAVAPCAGFARAYAVARPGQTIVVRRGTYPAQEIGPPPAPRTGPPVILRAADPERVRLTGPLVLDGAQRLVLEDLRLARPAEPERSLVLRPCTAAVTLRGVRGKTFLITEGVRRVRFVGGDWGGYRTPGDADSAIGTTGATGPTASCGGRPAGPARDVGFRGVRFHDVFWGVPARRWGGSHPDCFEVNGFVSGLAIVGSRFERCASTFLQINPDQGDIRDVEIRGNRFSRLGRDSWYGIQITSQGKPWRCDAVRFTANAYLPDTPHARTWPQAPIRTDCAPVAGGTPVLVAGNRFARAPPAGECRRYLAAPYRARWRDNAFGAGRCGRGAPRAAAS